MKLDLGKSSMGKRALLGAAAAATVIGTSITPAFADGYRHGRHYRPYVSHSYYYGGPYRGHYRHYDYRRHRGRVSGGEAALIAAGIIGGIILIDSAIDNSRRRAYDDYARYDGRRYDSGQRPGAWDDDYYYRRDGRDDDGAYDDYARRTEDDRYSRVARNDEELLGGPAPIAAERRAGPDLAVDAAFRECVAETRGAAGAGGMNVAMPGVPTEVTSLADGGVRMTAQFRASNARGESWTRRFVCEADEGGVRFLQVD
ncbi:MAG: hypothetical protein R3C60_11160 [Parvularculaceae bacterium]